MKGGTSKDQPVIAGSAITQRLNKHHRMLQRLFSIAHCSTLSAGDIRNFKTRGAHLRLHSHFGV